MAKQEEVDYTHELSHRLCFPSFCQHTVHPRVGGWVPPCQTYPTLARGMLHNAVHAYSSVKIHVTNLMWSVFWNWFLKIWSFCVWCYHIFKEALSFFYSTFFFKSTLQKTIALEVFSSILPTQSLIYPLKMLKPHPLFGFTVVLSAAGFQEVRYAENVPSRGERTNDFFVKNLRKFRRGLK